MNCACDLLQSSVRDAAVGNKVIEIVRSQNPVVVPLARRWQLELELAGRSWVGLTELYSDTRPKILRPDNQPIMLLIRSRNGSKKKSVGLVADLHA